MSLLNSTWGVAMDKYIAYILNALNGKDQVQTALDIKDWNCILDISCTHALHCYVYDFYQPFFKDQLRKDPSMIEWKNLCLTTVMRQRKDLILVKKVLKELIKEGVPYILMKGPELNNLYPNPSLRLIGDIDLLVHHDDLMRIQSIMPRFGYKHEPEKDTEKEIGFLHEEGLPFEVHHHLFKLSSFGNTDWFIKRVWETRQFDDTLDCFVMSATEGITYLLAHTAKHVLGTGIGLKTLYDIKLYISAHSTHIQWEQVNTDLKVLGIFDLSLYLLELCRRYLGLELNQHYSIDESMLSRLYELIIRAGNFGKSQEFILEKRYETLLYKEKQTKKRLFSLVFLPLSDMKDRYPLLQRYPVLLPFFWLNRIVKVVFKSKHSINELGRHDSMRQNVIYRKEIYEFFKK